MVDRCPAIGDNKAVAEDELLPVAGKEEAQRSLASHSQALVLQVVPEMPFCLNP